MNTAQHKLRIVLADDHQMIMEGLQTILEDENDIEVVGTALDGHEVLALLAEKEVDILVLDLSMPKMDGLTALKILKTQFPNVQTIILSYSNEGENIFAAMQAGAKGYVLKNRGGKDLVSAIQKVAGGGKFFPEEIITRMSEYLAAHTSTSEHAEHQETKISDREAEVIACLIDGLKTKEIGDLLCIASSTVETHKNNLKKRFGLSNIHSIITFGQKQGIAPYSKREKK